MALYQGEDISIAITGDDITNISNSNFVVLLSSKLGLDNVVLQGKNFSYIEGENCYLGNISEETTKDMLGFYDLEILLKNKSCPSNKSIFKAEKALYIEYSEIKNIDIEED